MGVGEEGRENVSLFYGHGRFLDVVYIVYIR